MHAAARLAVGMARVAVFSLLVLLLCIASTKANSINDLDYHTVTESSKDQDSSDDYDLNTESSKDLDSLDEETEGTGDGDYDDNEDDNEDDYYEYEEEDDGVVKWTEDTDFYDNPEENLCEGYYPMSEY